MVCGYKGWSECRALTPVCSVADAASSQRRVGCLSDSHTDEHHACQPSTHPLHPQPPTRHLQRHLLHGRIALRGKQQAEGKAVGQHVHIVL